MGDTGRRATPLSLGAHPFRNRETLRRVGARRAVSAWCWCRGRQRHTEDREAVCWHGARVRRGPRRAWCVRRAGVLCVEVHVCEPSSGFLSADIAVLSDAGKIAKSDGKRGSHRPQDVFLFTFPARACRRILQNEFRKQAILLQSFTVVSSRLLDAFDRAWYHLVVF